MSTLSIKVEVNYPGIDGNFKQFEQNVKNEVFRAGQELIRQAIDLYEKQKLDTGGYTIKEKLFRWIDTTLGTMEIMRYKIIDHNPKQGEPRVRFLVDKWMGIGKYQRETELLRDQICNQTVQRSFRKSAREIKNITSTPMSPMRIWDITQREAQKQKKLNKPIYRLPYTPLPDPVHKDQCPILCIEPDATYCHNKREWWKNHEVKVAILYTHKIKEGKKRWKLLNKTAVISKRNESVEKFLSRVAHVAVQKYQAHEKTKVVIRGDGDSWISRLKYDHFRQASFYLDPYHVFKKLELALGSREAAKKLKIHVYQQNPWRLLQEIKKLISQFADAQDKKKLEDFYYYIRHNIEGLLPDKDEIAPFKKQYPSLFKRGSGAIERNIALVINDRCKQPRMSWSEKGLDNILTLRESWLNKQFLKTPSKRFATLKEAIA